MKKILNVLFHMFMLGCVANVSYSASETNVPSKTILGTQTLAEHATVWIFGEDGQTAKQYICALREEDCRISRAVNGRIKNKHNQSRVYLKDEGGTGKELWSFWHGAFPVSYDFTLSSSATNTILVFASGCGIGIIDKLKENREADVLSDFWDEKPQNVTYIDLCKLLGKEAFDPDSGSPYSAVSLNLRVVKVYHAQDWNIVVRGKDSKEYHLRADGEKWVLTDR